MQKRRRSHPGRHKPKEDSQFDGTEQKRNSSCQAQSKRGGRSWSTDDRRTAIQYKQIYTHTHTHKQNKMKYNRSGQKQKSLAVAESALQLQKKTGATKNSKRKDRAPRSQKKRKEKTGSFEAARNVRRKAGVHWTRGVGVRAPACEKGTRNIGGQKIKEGIKE